MEWVEGIENLPVAVESFCEEIREKLVKEFRVIIKKCSDSAEKDASEHRFFSVSGFRGEEGHMVDLHRKDPRRWQVGAGRIQHRRGGLQYCATHIFLHFQYCLDKTISQYKGAPACFMPIVN